MINHEEDLDLYSKSAPVKRRKRNPGGNPSQKRPYYGELEDFDLGKGDPHIIFKYGTVPVIFTRARVSFCGFYDDPAQYTPVETEHFSGS
jgi:hypothetical protein